MILRGWENIEEVENNFNYQGEVLIGDKFIDEELDLSGCIILKLDNGLYSLIIRQNMEYGIKFNKFQYDFFDVDNLLNFIKMNMNYLQYFSYSKIKSILLT